MGTLKTKCMGLDLESPVIVGSSGKTSTAASVAELGRAGAGAVVLKSLFEEQIVHFAAQEARRGGVVYGQQDLDGFISYYERKHTVAEYLQLIRDSKKGSPIPIIPSINAVSEGEWVNFAGELVLAGADGIQLNLFIPISDPNKDSEVVERHYVEILRRVKMAVRVPVAVKIGPFFTNLPGMIRALEGAGADGIVLFNRYYSPDINIESLSIKGAVPWSNPMEFTQGLRWIALLSKFVKTPLIGATGIHDGQTLIKFLLAGAPAVEVVSAVYQKGFSVLGEMNDTLSRWMAERQYGEIDQFRGKMALGPETSEAQRSAIERFQYMKTFGDRED